MTELTRFQYIRAVIAKWIVVNIAAKISHLAVLSLCLEIHDLYIAQYEAQEEL
jgi:hypothetical protein